MRAARRAHAGIMPGVSIRQGLIPTPSAIIPTSGALYHRLPPPLTGGARAGQMAWRRWSGIEGPHVQPPPHYPAYPMAACQVSYARPSLCLAPLLITPLAPSPLPLPTGTRARRQDLVGCSALMFSHVYTQHAAYPMTVCPVSTFCHLAWVSLCCLSRAGSTRRLRGSRGFGKTSRYSLNLGRA